MSRKNLLISVLSAMLLLSLGIYYYFSIDNEATNDLDNTTNSKNNIMYTQKEIPEVPINEKERKYYIVYIKLEDGSGSSFVPLNLNPDFKNDSDLHVSISFDDNGNIVNGEKIIQIDNFVISDENKEEIKKIAGEKNFDKALKEIEERVNDTRKNLAKEGLI